MLHSCAPQNSNKVETMNLKKNKKNLGDIRHRGGFGVGKGKREMVQLHYILKTKRRRGLYPIVVFTGWAQIKRLIEQRPAFSSTLQVMQCKTTTLQRAQLLQSNVSHSQHG